MVAITPTGQLTVRAAGPSFAPERSAVRDSRGLVSGRVVRVFGPVARPYLSVRLRRAVSPATAAALLGASMVRDPGESDAAG